VAYQLNVVPEADRRSRIAQAQPTDRVLTLRYRSQLRDLPRVVIPIDTPIYRMANIRTIVKQLTYLSNNQVADDFFKGGQEDVLAQRAQHDLLVDLSKANSADIYGLLAKQKEQTEPLLVTAFGVIVNGNRRLAAMRDLYTRDSQEFRRFEHIEVAVLPADATEDDLAQIETDFQIAPDMRLDYGWVEQALGLKHQTDDLGWSLEKAAAHWQETESELKRKLSVLALADQYLAHMGESGKYERIATDELAFKVLQGRQAARPDEAPSRLEAERLVVFAELANKSEVEGRIYDHARAIDKVLDKVLTNPDVNLPANEPQRVDNAPTDGDLLGQLPEQGNGVAEVVLDKLRDRAAWPTIAAAADRAHTMVKEEQRQEKRVSRFASEAEQINATASRLSLQNANPDTLSVAAAQLVSAVKEIADRLAELRTDYPQAMDGIDGDRLTEAVDTLHRLTEQG